MPVSQGTSTSAYAPRVTRASMSSHDMPASAVTTYSPGASAIREGPVGGRRGARDFLAGHIGLAGDLRGHDDGHARGRLLVTGVRRALDGALRTETHHAGDAGVRLRSRSLIAASDDGQQYGSEHERKFGTHAAETSRLAGRFPRRPCGHDRETGQWHHKRSPLEPVRGPRKHRGTRGPSPPGRISQAPVHHTGRGARTGFAASCGALGVPGDAARDPWS